MNETNRYQIQIALSHAQCLIINVSNHFL